MFIVALLTGRIELAKLLVQLGFEFNHEVVVTQFIANQDKPFLQYDNDVFGDYLVGCLICRGVLKTLPYEYISLQKKYEQLADEFENSAISLLEKCAESNLARTEDLVIRELPHWGRHSCIELAIQEMF